MNSKVLTNVAASIRQRLLNFSRETGRPFDEILQYYMIERFIDRLSKSPYKKQFILKGALMFVVWQLTDSRATRDIDFLGKTKNSTENIKYIFQTVCRLAIPQDGVVFFPEQVVCEPIQKQSDYVGIRTRFQGELAGARIHMQIDIGFDDVVYPKPTPIQYPTFLEMVSPELYGYTPETLIAEKVHAIMRHGIQGSRMKDYFDVSFLSRQFSFHAKSLFDALSHTFNRRKMTLSQLTFLSSKTFQETIDFKNKQCAVFIKKNNLDGVSQTFPKTLEQLRDFIEPLYKSNSKDIVRLRWYPPGPWR